jgi:hypothetical protein
VLKIVANGLVETFQNVSAGRLAYRTEAEESVLGRPRPKPISDTIAQTQLCRSERKRDSKLLARAIQNLN